MLSSLHTVAPKFCLSFVFAHSAPIASISIAVDGVIALGNNNDDSGGDGDKFKANLWELVKILNCDRSMK